MNENDFFTALCAKFGYAATPWRLAVFKEWHRLEGMPLETTWNPLATTRLSPATPLNLSYDIGYGPGNWNSVPVRVYATPEAGVQATYETLMLDYYPNVRRCLVDQRGYDEAIPELRTYIGSDGYATGLVAFMKAQPVPPVSAPPPPAVTLADIVAALGGADAIKAWNARGNSLLLGYTEEQEKLAAEINARVASAVIQVVINGVTVPLTKVNA